MEKYELILELLEKETLTDDEKNLLERESNSDEGVKKIINLFNSLKSSLTSSEHIDFELDQSIVKCQLVDSVFESYFSFYPGDKYNDIVEVLNKIKDQMINEKGVKKNSDKYLNNLFISLNTQLTPH